MQHLTFSVLFAAFAALAVHAAQPQANAELAQILGRQAPGTPEYECHSNCGNAILAGRDSNHCSNATWVGYYEACLQCALQYDIWKYYGDGVTSAASACGLNPTPSPSGDAGSTVVPSTSATASVPTSGTTTAQGAATTAASSGIAITAPPNATHSETAVSRPSATSSTVTAGAPGREVHRTVGYTLTVSSVAAILAGLFGGW
ncbi:ddb02977-591a-4e59-b80e-010ec0dfe913 [Thermothielavioides terrestris]|uniref:Ddb02977-591a-4e59-b80e-010ec0dfe913 n=1 Tax=Thermothielavioides terrestris TaxID=2587410 RepID=A0A446BG81_9PEZI|nr:ddb02977-591a-4e59-b80e-010ec0dfe913 [Thermothielavioides terrestris]